MKTYAMTIDLKDDPEILALYEEYHSNVWPEVRQAVKKVGMENVRIFRFGTRLVQIFDARDDFDITKDIDAYAEDPVVRKWDTMMNGFQVPLNGRREGEWWAEMELVYDSNMYPD
ncbi:L-rhamnose mutarotase [Enterocloster aldenensis]|uniref:L-rhamnose mutarotase n=1 Tax=Enterocloster aldenensis TaxID=358742 RepID=UPI004024BCB2